MPLMDVTGDWALTQSNSAVVQLHIDQQLLPVTGTVKLTGFASHGSVKSSDLNGTMRGSGEGSPLMLVIRWNNGTVGEYHGVFGPFLAGTGGSRLTGTTFDQAHPTSQATWVSQKLFHFGPV